MSVMQRIETSTTVEFDQYNLTMPFQTDTNIPILGPIVLNEKDTSLLVTCPKIGMIINI